MQPTNLIPLIMQFLTPAVIDKIADTLGLDAHWPEPSLASPCRPSSEP